MPMSMPLPIPIPTEMQEQIALCKYLDYIHADYWHTANERKTGARQGAMLKRMGVKSGIPDIIVLPNIAIELKRRHGGKVTDSQKQWHSIFIAHGWNVIIGYGAEDTISKLTPILGKPKT